MGSNTAAEQQKEKRTLDRWDFVLLALHSTSLNRCSCTLQVTRILKSDFVLRIPEPKGKVMWLDLCSCFSIRIKNSSGWSSIVWVLWHLIKCSWKWYEGPGQKYGDYPFIWHPKPRLVRVPWNKLCHPSAISTYFC